MSDGEVIRERQRATWAGLAPGWERWDAIIMEQLRPVTAAMIERIRVAPHQRHIDVASGTGEPGLSIAELAPQGLVVLTDLSPEMLAVASRRASARGIRNVESRVCSAEALPFGDATFDSVTVRFGYMFFPDLAAATAEFARVLAPGGQLCSAVWVAPEANPWTSIVMDAIASEVAVEPSDPDRPSMYRCAAPGMVAALYERAGFGDVAEWDVDVQLVTRSTDEWWAMTSEHVSLAAALLPQLDEAARRRVRARAIDAVRAFVAGDGTVRVPGRARCIGGAAPPGRQR